ncbi:S9 family peptidase [Rugosimonospora africana]|uniref:S9 family peptidase n=1 Tax=Rugosimonospora africana TaxID=556532 RepID=UPI001944F7BC|nr:prolyl oligopeptidase family serine peptidase [Rugosimonospora africana]
MTDVFDPAQFSPARFTALGRLTSLALSPDGSRLIAVRQEPDAKGARYVPALWQIDPDGQREPTRLTWSEKGENQPAFRPDGSLLFVSGRPDSDGEDDEPALWELPTFGEARVVARAPGGVSSPLVARESGTVLLRGSRLAGVTDTEADREARRDRADRKLNHILHDGYPIRFWDHELGDAWPCLFALDESVAPSGPAVGGESDGDGGRDSDGLRALAGGARKELVEAGVSLSADGRLAAVTWRVRIRGAQRDRQLALIDVDSGAVRTLAADEGYLYSAPTISPDGRLVASVKESIGDFDTPMTYALVVHEVDSAAAPVEVPVGDVYPAELAWSGDGSTLVVSGDLHGRGAVLAVTVDGWKVRTLADDAAYLSVCVDRTGETVYALRTTIDRPPHPVRLRGDGTPVELPAPDAAPALPGTLTDVTAVAPDGQTVRGWLCVPHGVSAESAAPVQVWIHGGPFASTNSWSWRWCPWTAVARGYAVLMPDPALSTGYGPQWLARAWPHRAGLVWSDIEALLDDVLKRPELDADRTACLGGSFGGYMTNWVAGHTDRFGAIVTHAGLWALDQQHTTTDAADWKSGLFGTPAEHPDWYAENSPNNFVDSIRTPMLVVHGNRDYRVPVSEALRLWWDLVSRFDGEPDELPHRFLQFTDENHWILSPGNAQIWYETVLDFVDRHVRG